jgi:phospholipase/lecithinase/hemolysin
MAVRFFALLCLGLVEGFSGGVCAQTQQFSSLYVFGDSLSDSGNLFGLTGGITPPSPAHFNGPVIDVE